MPQVRWCIVIGAVEAECARHGVYTPTHRHPPTAFIDATLGSKEWHLTMHHPPIRTSQ